MNSEDRQDCAHVSIGSICNITGLAMLSLPIYNIFLWLLLPDLIGSLMRFLYLKPSVFLMNIIFAL